jgi:hypothetical protein
MKAILDLIDRASRARWISLITPDPELAIALGRFVGELDSAIARGISEFKKSAENEPSATPQ